MKEIEFCVQGTAIEPYRVTFIQDECNLNAFCTCPAGKYGPYCKHRFAILRGEVKGITSKNIDQVAEVRSWFLGTNLEIALVELSEAEYKYNIAKERLAIAKKNIAQAMGK
jgi:uncharacterized Zn finger protein